MKSFTNHAPAPSASAGPNSRERLKQKVPWTRAQASSSSIKSNICAHLPAKLSGIASRRARRRLGVATYRRDHRAPARRLGASVLRFQTGIPDAAVARCAHAARSFMASIRIKPAFGKLYPRHLAANAHFSGFLAILILPNKHGAFVMTGRKINAREQGEVSTQACQFRAARFCAGD